MEKAFLTGGINNICLENENKNVTQIADKKYYTLIKSVEFFYSFIFCHILFKLYHRILLIKINICQP